ncbi:MAG: ADP-glyceromanno-heptose 6-epimerase [Deltaproteobacteria bacterium]|nr:ADP-glyceromanno-heptose 6-epimerase [Deltaproteobacteria bacterium]
MIILTGGAGFIGSAFLWKLNAAGRSDVLVVDDLGHSDKWKNLRGRQFSDLVSIGDFSSRLASGEALGNIDAIVHLGACSATTERNADYMMENNYRSTRRLAEWAISRGVYMQYASSAATYGDGVNGFSDDPSLLSALVPQNVYGYSKHMVDLWARESGAAAKLVGLKYFNVFGPNEYHKEDMRSVVVKAFEEIRSTGKLGLFRSYRNDFADGEQKRDFIYVKDCVDAMMWLLEHREVRGLFNLGTGKARSWNDLARSVFSAMKAPEQINYVEMPEGMRDRYQYFTEASMNRLAAAGCPVSFRSLEESIHDYVVNYLTPGHGFL